MFAFDTTGKVLPVYCGKWSCPNCAQKLADKWAKRVEIGLSSLGALETPRAWFLTLTFGQEYSDPLKAYANLPHLWDAIRKQYQRYYGSFCYIAFVEGQQRRNDMPHFHIVSENEPPIKRGRAGHVTKRGVHDWAHAMGFGFMADLQLIGSAQAAAYVSKYASKGTQSVPKNFRRVRVARTWPKLPEPEGLTLIVQARSEVFAHYILRVADITGLDPGYLVETWDMEHLRLAKTLKRR
jgi:hypothetical protein